MSDLRAQLRDYVEENIERVDVDDVRAAVSRPDAPSRPRRPGLRPAWAFVLGAVFVLLAGGIPLLFLGGDSTTPDVTEPPVATQPTTPEVSTPTTSAAVVPTDIVAGWNPILATTRAGEAPATATCPPDSFPDIPGPVDQERPPLAGFSSNQSSVFDQHTGRVIHVDDFGQTWAFDVCTNTWTRLNPVIDMQGLVIERPQGIEVPSPLVLGELVYDVDSDATLFIRDGAVLVYDAADNTWMAQWPPPKSYSIVYPGLGAVYDPVSGLVVVQTGDHGLVAYDVDTNTWTEVGTLPGDYPGFLIGYSAEADRLYFLGFQSDGVAVDPRSGQTEPLAHPAGGVMGGWGAFAFATGADTAYTRTFVADPPETEYLGGGEICRLDPATLDWDCFADADFSRGVQDFQSMVADPVNNRLLAFHGSCCSLYPLMHDDVWALDLDTGEWSLVLQEANQQRHR